MTRDFPVRNTATPLHTALAFTSLALAVASGCSGDSAAPRPLTIYAGAGLRPAVSELAEEFRRHHDVQVECDYAGSETLLGRIKLARRGDLYLPGDASYVDQARQAGLISSSRDACYLVPVIIVAPDNPQSIRGPRDLTKPDLRLGLGDAQACAIGRKCSKMFAKNKIAEADIEANVVFRSLTVNELGDKVKLGHLDAAIVWEAVAEQFEDSVKIVRIPVEQNVISRVTMGVLTCSKNRETATQFVEFAVSEAGREIFRKHGYTTELPTNGHAD